MLLLLFGISQYDKAGSLLNWLLNAGSDQYEDEIKTNISRWFPLDFLQWLKKQPISFIWETLW